jgi:hypothetical protein
MDHRSQLVIAMNKIERQAMIDKLQADNAADLADIAERREQREARGEIDAFEHWDSLRSRSAPTRQPRSESLVFKTYEPQPPTMQQATWDAATEARWTTWVDARVAAHIDAVVDVVAEESATENKKLRKWITALEAELAMLRAQVEGTVTKMRGRDDSNAA